MQQQPSQLLFFFGWTQTRNRLKEDFRKGICTHTISIFGCNSFSIWLSGGGDGEREKKGNICVHSHPLTSWKKNHQGTDFTFFIKVLKKCGASIFIIKFKIDMIRLGTAAKERKEIRTTTRKETGREWSKSIGQLKGNTNIKYITRLRSDLPSLRNVSSMYIR